MSEQLVNLYSDTLAAPYTAGDGHITVTTGNGALVSGTFSLTILNSAGTVILLIFRVTSVSGGGTQFNGAAEGADASAASGSVVIGTMQSAAAIDQIEADTVALAVAAAESVILPVSLTSGVTGVLPRANGGLASASPGTGLLRDGSPPTASELSGDVVTLGSNSVAVVGVNGAAVPVSAKALATNSTKQLIAVTPIGTGVPLFVGFNPITAVFLDDNLDANTGATLVASIADRGLYRVSCTCWLTTVGGVSSTLPSTQLQYTWQGVARTCTLGGTSTVNTISASTQVTDPQAYGNSATTSCLIVCDAGTTVTFSQASYASNPANAMKFSLIIVLERLA